MHKFLQHLPFIFTSKFQIFNLFAKDFFKYFKIKFKFKIYIQFLIFKITLNYIHCNKKIIYNLLNTYNRLKQF